MIIKRAVFGQAVWIDGKALNTIGENEKIKMEWDSEKSWMILQGRQKVIVFPTNISYMSIAEENKIEAIPSSEIAKRAVGTKARTTSGTGPKA